MPILLHFSWWCCDGNLTFLVLVRCFKATNRLFYQSKLLPLTLCCLLLLQDTPRCPVFQELCEHALWFRRWASASSNFHFDLVLPIWHSIMLWRFPLEVSPIVTFSFLGLFKGKEDFDRGGSARLTHPCGLTEHQQRWWRWPPTLPAHADTLPLP